MIILSYMGEYELINEKIQYNVRKETENFLKEFIFKQNDLKIIESWENHAYNGHLKEPTSEKNLQDCLPPTYLLWYIGGI